jgi:hypothetical protein
MTLPDIPPEVARVFVGYMRAYHAEKSQNRRDAIAAEVAVRLQKYLPPRAKKLRLLDIEELFHKMRGE